TSFSRDWSSDVCSSDLDDLHELVATVAVRGFGARRVVDERSVVDPAAAVTQQLSDQRRKDREIRRHLIDEPWRQHGVEHAASYRSEERRVGAESTRRGT